MVKRATIVAFLTLCLALSALGDSKRALLSREKVVRIADVKVSREMGSSPFHYRRVGVSFLADERTWIVSYREKTFGSRFTVEVNDRTGESVIWMP